MSLRNCIWLILIICVNANDVQSQSLEPYKARVLVDKVFLRSGPGQNYYPTSFLQRDTIVEVYRQTNGWLAIRPPEDAFSLVPAEYVEYDQTRSKAKIRTAETPCYVGSQISSHHHVLQVELKFDESVHVLGITESREADTGKKKVFYRIAPPSGEFRWINEHFIKSIEPSYRTLRDPEADPESLDQLAASTEAIEPWQSKKELKTLRTVAFENETGNETETDKVQTEAPSTDEAMPPEPGKLPVEPTTQPAVPATTLTIVELELRVSQEVVKPAETWQLKPLRERAVELSKIGESPLERGRARLVLDKLEELEALYERKIALKAAASTLPQAVLIDPTADPDVGDATSNLLDPTGLIRSAASMVDPAASFKKSGIDPRYDGHGWLMPVVTRASTQKKAGYTPPFALTDNQGNVIQFVSPSPGLNLRRYAKMQVGIYGQVSPLAQLTHPHLTAHRVVVLSRHEKR